MKRCSATHDYDDGTSGPLHWLDWQAPDDRCPRCGAVVEWFAPGALGALLEAPLTGDPDRCGDRSCKCWNTTTQEDQ